jgi:hypothetical protein
LRNVFRGRVTWAHSYLFAFAEGDLLAFAISPGTPGATLGRDGDGRYLDRVVAGEAPRANRWKTHHILWLFRVGEAHALGLLWDAQWRFKQWYVDLQAPLVETRFGYDTADHALDIDVQPDGTWSWKDEDDFAESIALGVLTEAEAATVRAEGERVIAARPWPTGYEDWRPPADWTPPPLPEGWDVV